ncbi:MAG: hypothetical protein N3A62_02870, partial [Thermodesulfovibrionales bacterium]|nr:hypothetical protein [Thermodesulfovibrionales bacterium]
MKRAVVVMVCMLILVVYGCGSSSSTSSPQTGHVVGSIIDNMPYKCGDKSGRTGRLGNFTYTPGQDCTFSLGKMNFTVSPI